MFGLALMSVALSLMFFGLTLISFLAPMGVVSPSLVLFCCFWAIVLFSLGVTSLVFFGFMGGAQTLSHTVAVVSDDVLGEVLKWSVTMTLFVVVLLFYYSLMSVRRLVISCVILGLSELFGYAGEIVVGASILFGYVFIFFMILGRELYTRFFLREFIELERRVKKKGWNIKYDSFEGLKIKGPRSCVLPVKTPILMTTSDFVSSEFKWRFEGDIETKGMNELCLFIEKPGIYTGVCVNTETRETVPLTIKAVSYERYLLWGKKQMKKQHG